MGEWKSNLTLWRPEGSAARQGPECRQERGRSRMGHYSIRAPGIDTGGEGTSTRPNGWRVGSKNEDPRAPWLMQLEAHRTPPNWFGEDAAVLPSHLSHRVGKRYVPCEACLSIVEERKV